MSLTTHILHLVQTLLWMQMIYLQLFFTNAITVYSLAEFPQIYVLRRYLLGNYHTSLIFIPHSNSDHRKSAICNCIITTKSWRGVLPAITFPTSVKAPSLPLSMPPRIQLAFCTARAHCWLVSSFLSTRTLIKPFSTGLLSSSYPTHTWDHYYPSATPCIWPYWTLLGSHGPTFKAFSGPSGWLPFLLLCQLQLSAWCHLQTLRIWTHYPCNQ